MNDSRPIGVFDSGIGGLTVVKALRDLLPNETISYLGDTARVPYGSKSAETVQRYGVELAEMLIAGKRKNTGRCLQHCFISGAAGSDEKISPCQSSVSSSPVRARHWLQHATATWA